MVSRASLAAVLMVASVACGRAVGNDSDTDGGTPGSDAGSPADAGSPVDAESGVDAGTLLTTVELIGPWLNEAIGNCIDEEMWLYFTVEGGVAFIAGEFNACMDPSEHCRVDRQGSYRIDPGGVLRFEWVDASRTVISRRSSSVVDLAEPGAPQPQLHLSLFTYWRIGGGWRWVAHREGEVLVAPGTPESYIAVVRTDTEITIDRDPRTLGSGELAIMDVRLSYEMEPTDGGPGVVGQESFTFDAALDAAMGFPGWPMLTVLQAGQEVQYQWWELLEARGIFDQLPQEAATRFWRAFHGFLLVEDAGAAQLLPYPGYSFGGWFWRAEIFDPRPAPACTGAALPYAGWLP